MNKHIQDIRQRGDTIVEVLIALTVVTAVLVGAFVVTQHSAISVRNGQEHSEVTQILQSQVEKVRSLASKEDSDDDGVFATGYFCVITNASGVHERLDASDTRCKTIDALYSVSINYNSGSKSFIFIGTWDSLTGDTNREMVTYRVYPGL